MIRVSYQGNLQTTATHLQSEQSFTTDAPADNYGQGQSFSPTDLVATAAASCMLTSMGILAKEQMLDMGLVSAEVEKIMTPPPRRIAQLRVELKFENHNLSDSDKLLAEQAALSCAVTRSLHPDVVVNVKFRYS